MSFYVLEMIGSRWGKNILGYNPYRITWENPKSGQKICEIFIKMIGDNERDGMDIYESVRMGFHFYKYKKSFDFSLKPSDRPNPISNVYIPSKPIVYIEINKTVTHALNLLETVENGSTIIAVSDEELAQALEETESGV